MNKKSSGLSKTEKSQTQNRESTDDALVIVESPTKARALTRYLGKGYRVLASGGHIIDLPPKKFGVDIDKNFAPDYELLRGKKKIADTLAAAARDVKTVYLATDPDREGEAIAWHISRYIAPTFKGKIFRVQFHEITKKAIIESLKEPGDIDKNKVDAQQARRVMDRIVGYKVSPLLWKTVARGLSAGRVQSVALRLICEREAEITVFVSVEYWTIDGKFKGESVEPFSARLVKLDGNKVEIPFKKEANQVVKRLKDASYRVIDIKKSQKKRSPYPPYITSTLQQDAGRRLGFTVKRTMAVAQQLYEGIELGSKGQTGLITYMRTDSIRVSNEAITSARDWVASNLSPEFLANTPRIFKNKKGKSQDAHEAIRPTDVSLTPEKVKEYFSPEQFKLYDLIWRRFVATQMKEAAFNVTTVIIGDGNGIEFNASGQTMVFSGFLQIYNDLKTNGEENNITNVPEGLKVKMPLELQKLDPIQHFTQPPSRYTEAGLVKELDELGIGRPSTYSSIISTLIDRKYVEREKRSFFPTDLGTTVNSILVLSFPNIFNVKFTADMEEQLDRIETGGKWQSVLGEFYKPFNDALLAVESRKDELKKTTMHPVGRNCPECSEELMYRWGKLGRFISCSGFPKCKYKENIEPREPIDVKEKCPKCGGEMNVRDGRYGRFLGCKNYPECKGILPFTTGFKCPKDDCKGNIVERKSKKGRLFYGCDKYPDCKTTSWDPPVKGPCPDCGAETIFEKELKTGIKRTCLKCGWKGEE